MLDGLDGCESVRCLGEPFAQSSGTAEEVQHAYAAAGGYVTALTHMRTIAGRTDGWLGLIKIEISPEANLDLWQLKAHLRTTRHRAGWLASARGTPTQRWPCAASFTTVAFAIAWTGRFQGCLGGGRTLPSGVNESPCL